MVSHRVQRKPETLRTRRLSIQTCQRYLIQKLRFPPPLRHDLFSSLPPLHLLHLCFHSHLSFPLLLPSSFHPTLSKLNGILRLNTTKISHRRCGRRLRVGVSVPAWFGGNDLLLCPCKTRDGRREYDTPHTLPAFPGPAFLSRS